MLALRRSPFTVAFLTATWLYSGSTGCGGGDGSPRPAGAKVSPSEPLEPAAAGASPNTTSRRVTISVVGLNDLHGHVERLPIIAGYVDNLRSVRARDGGGVIVVDAGDLFQGTLVSNLGEGVAVVDGYEALGVASATIGNHEFDYGPIGPRAVVDVEADGDPRGALKARAREADFPILLANILDGDTGARVDWPGMPPTHVVEVAGVRVGIVGVTTAATLNTTLRANVEDLRMASLPETAVAEARRLRREADVDVVIVTAHAGGGCDDFEDAGDLDTCQGDAEIFRAVRTFPTGLVDLVVAGHTHQGIAHRVAGVPVIESYAYGRAFGRVDLVVDRAAGAVVDAVIHPPHRVCAGDEHGRDVAVADCRTGDYEGAPVQPADRVTQVLAPHQARAKQAEARRLGVRLGGRFPQRYREETALGNLLTDLMRRARPRADVALQNGGGIRDDLPAGPLRYGDLYETFPFDNRFAFVRMRGQDLAAMIARNLRGRNGFLSVSGVRAVARCLDGKLGVSLYRAPGGGRIAPDAELVVVTNEYLVTSRDPVIRRLPDDAIEVEDGPPLRDVLAELLARGGAGQLDPASYHDPAAPRVGFPGDRPVRCP